jgi:aspartyl-tRNA(Asn)/glutamyl-tRNA(Gln) amidotransferase subunit C
MSRAEIERVANTAKLDVSGESDDFIEEVNNLLAIMQLQIDTDGYADYKSELPGISETEPVNTFREDEAKPSLPRELVLMNAPETEAGCISIPKAAGTETETGGEAYV